MRQRATFKRIQVNVSTEFDALIGSLRQRTGEDTTAEIFRFSIMLLDAAVNARAAGNRLAIVDQRGRIVNDIVIPYRSAVPDKATVIRRRGPRE